MKKLMIAALAACSIGAYATDNTCAPGEVPAPTLVYKFKATVYTPKGISRTEAAVPGSVCTPDDTGTAGGTNVIRAKDKTKFAGWIYDCNATCETVANGSIVVWDSKRKAQLNEAGMEKQFIHVIGKKQKDAEWRWDLTGGTATYNYGPATYTLHLAGFGKYSAKKGFYTSFKGNFAGDVSAVTYVPKGRPSSADDCVPAGFWVCTDLKTLVTEDDSGVTSGVAYGCWSVKYSKSASKKFNRNGYLKVPKYVTVASN